MMKDTSFDINSTCSRAMLHPFYTYADVALNPEDKKTISAKPVAMPALLRLALQLALLQSPWEW